jgi:signal transduction histidine kinase
LPSRVAIHVERECPLAGALADRLRESKRELVMHWLQRITDRVSISPERLFPTADLLDHVPMLVEGIAAYLEDPAAQIMGDTPVVGKAMELGRLRHSQGFDAYEILKEYEILGGILFNYLATAADEMPEPCEKSELLVCGQRLFSAIAIIQQTTTTHYLQLASEKVAEREQRLRGFNRALSHEIRNHVNTILGAGDGLLTMPEMQDAERAKFHEVIVRHARQMKTTLENLTELARFEADARQQRNVRLPAAVKEAVRQLREMASAARVDIRVDPALLDLEVNAPVVELALMNYLTNAIKYADPSRGGSFIEIGGAIQDGRDDGGPELVISVRDNGLGVPPEKRDRLFERFFRAHETITEAEGTGLGLSIVRETVESIGGRAWAVFPEQGSVFFFSVPYRRGSAERRTRDAATREERDTAPS